MSVLLHGYPCTRAVLAAAGATIVAVEAIKFLAGVLG